MLQILGRLVLGKVLTDAKVKKAVLDELKELVNDPESEVDERAVGVAEAIWDVLVGVLIGPI